MARSPAQSDFVVVTTPPPVDPASAGGDPAALPTATVRSSEASESATKWVMGLTWFVLIAFVLLLVIGPHIPSGE